MLVAGTLAAVADPAGPTPAAAADEPVGFATEPVVEGLSLPTAMAFLPDGRLLIAQKDGTVAIADVSDGTTDTGYASYLTIPDVSVSQEERGLVGIAVDGEFASHPYIYVWYAREVDPDPAVPDILTLERYTHTGSVADPASGLVLFQDPDGFPLTSCCHLGGVVEWGPDNTVWLAVGDKTSPAPGETQDPELAKGKLLRLHRDGTIPAGNPHYDGDGPHLDGIWSVGLRNPWKGSWDRATQRLVFGEVGQDTWEDVNVVDPADGGGEDFGWPECEGQCTDPAFTDPLFSYNHDNLPWTGTGGSITGGPVYRGNMFPSEWVGRYFFGDFANRRIRYFDLDDDYNIADPQAGPPPAGDDTTFHFAQHVGPIVDLVEGPDGALYHLSLHVDGGDYGTTGYVTRTYYDDPDNPPVITQADANVTIGDDPLAVTFTGAATDTDSLPAEVTYTWIFGDGNQATGAIANHTYTAPGTYLARLEVNDLTRTTTSEVIEITAGVTPRGPEFDTSFAVFGDFGSLLPAEEDVANLVDSFAPEFIVTTGDNLYTSGGTYQTGVGDYYGSYIGGIRNRFFPSPGNHDYTDPTNGITDYLSYFDLPGAGTTSSNTSGNERYYDVVEGPVHVFLIDSDPLLTDPIESAAQQAWLQAQLAASTAPWQVVALHHPPYSSASDHGSEPAVQWPYAAWGADAVFAGHDHTYERLSVDGIPYFVSGLGGQNPRTFGTIEQGSVVRYNAFNGSMIVGACNVGMAFEFHAYDDVQELDVLVDSNSVGVACDGGLAPPVSPSSLAASAMSAWSIQVTWSDNSSDETGFDIEYSSTGIDGPWMPAGSVGAGVETFLHGSLSTDTEYCYRVLATNGDGSSPPSNAACTITAIDADVLLVGDSITEGTPTDAPPNRFDHSYRCDLWHQLTGGGAPVDFVGSKSSLTPSEPCSGVVTFDDDHEGYGGQGLTSGFPGFEHSRLIDLMDTSGILTSPYDAVLVHLGTNDKNGVNAAWNAAYVDGIEAELRNLIDGIDLPGTQDDRAGLRENPNATIYVSKIIPCDFPPGGGFLGCDITHADMNERFEEVAAELSTPASPIVLIDHTRGFSKVSDLKIDNVHPNAAGASKMADNWALGLETFGINLAEPVAVSGTGSIGWTPSDAVWNGRALSCAIVPNLGEAGRASVGSDCALGSFDASGLAGGEYTFRYSATDFGNNTWGSATHFGEVTVTVTGPPAGGVDVLLQNSVTGLVALWELNSSGGFVGGSVVADPGSNAWVVVASGDFIAGGGVDVLLQNTTSGVVALWELDSSGGFVGGSVLTDPGSVDWVVVASGDFVAGGGVDVLAQNSTSGVVEVWELTTSGGFVGSSLVADPGSNAWVVVAAGDFITGGGVDVLLQNTTSGVVAVWELNAAGGFVAGSVVANPGSNAWVVVAAGDFIIGGGVDVLLQNTTSGVVALWELTTSGGYVAGTVVANPGSAWVVVASGEFITGGGVDVLLQNTTTGLVALWELNTSGGYVAGTVVANPGTTWTIVEANNFIT